MRLKYALRMVEDSGLTAVREVFLTREGKPFGYSRAEAIHTVGDKEGAQDVILRQLMDMIDATMKPVLHYPEDFVMVNLEESSER